MATPNGPTILMLADLPATVLEMIASRCELIGQGPRDGSLHDRHAEAEIILIRSPFTLRGPSLAEARRLRWIVRAGSGLDNIDVEEARSRGIRLYTIPISAPSVAELGFGLMLASARQIPRLDASMRRGEWQKGQAAGLLLQGKTLLIVGFGAIGQAVARIAGGFQMRVLAADRSPEKPQKVEALSRIVGARFVALEEGLAEAEILVLCCPLTANTRHLIDRARLARLPPGAIIVNVARGEIVDPIALYDALESGHVSGAGLDVHDPEPPGVTPLLGHPAVVSTPHVGSQTRDIHWLLGRAVADLIDETILPEWRTLAVERVQ